MLLSVVLINFDSDASVTTIHDRSTLSFIFLHEFVHFHLNLLHYFMFSTSKKWKVGQPEQGSAAGDRCQGCSAWDFGGVDPRTYTNTVSGGTSPKANGRGPKVEV